MKSTVLGRSARLIALVMGAVLSACTKQEAAGGGKFEPPPVAVTVVKSVSEDVPVYIDEIGKTAASEVVTVAPQIDGPIMALHFKDGDNLTKGQSLFSIDPRPFQATVDQAMAKLAQDQATLQFAKNQFDRVNNDAARKAITQEDFDTRQNNYIGGQAQVAASEAAVRTAQLNLSYCEIHSPIDGRASVRLVDAGNYVKTGAGLVVIQRLDPVYADFTVNEQELADVRKNMAQDTLRAEVSIPSDPDHPRKGDLTFLDNAVQDFTGTVKLRATLANADHFFWPGQFVKVRLVLKTLKDAVLIPTLATQISQQGTFVYVIKADSTAELRPVVLGQRQGELVVVSDGLKGGESVVARGQLLVQPGGKVSVLPDAPAGAPAGPPAKASGPESKETLSKETIAEGSGKS